MPRYTIGAQPTQDPSGNPGPPQMIVIEADTYVIDNNFVTFLKDRRPITLTKPLEAGARRTERAGEIACDELLFDDVMWVENAKRDHFDFTNKLRDRGVSAATWERPPERPPGSRPRCRPTGRK